MQLPVVIEITKPVMHGSKEIREIDFSREMVGADVYDLDLAGGQVTGRDFAKLAGRLSGLPDPVIGALPVTDFLKVVRAVNNFLLDGPETGPSASPSSPGISSGHPGN